MELKYLKNVYSENKILSTVTLLVMKSSVFWVFFADDSLEERFVFTNSFESTMDAF